jgi:Bacterial Ig domain
MDNKPQSVINMRLGLLMRSILAVILILLPMASPADAVVRGGSPPLTAVSSSFTPAWAYMPLGDGGQKTGFDYHASTDLLLVRNDTWGAHYRKTTGSCANGATLTFPAPCWQQVVTAASMPPDDVNVDTAGSNNVGSTEYIACDGNQNVQYLLWNTSLYVSVDFGQHWVKTSIRTGQGANSGPKYAGKFLWCDPADPNGNIIYVATVAGVGSSANGLFRSTNGTSGASRGTSTAIFSQVTTANAPSASAPQLIASDPNSPVVNGVTQHIYVWSPGRGLFETTNGGTFAPTAGSPTGISAVKLRIDKFSQVWLIDATRTIHVRLAGAWVTKTYEGINGIANITFDPTSTTVETQRIFGSWYDGNIFVSNDNGRTWVANNRSYKLSNTFTAPAGQPPWLGTANQCNNPCSFGTYFNVLDYIVDASGRVWAAGGIAPWYTSTLTGIPTTQWTVDAVGIEQLVSNRIMSALGIPPTIATWDRGVLLVQTPGAFPILQVPNITTIGQIEAAWGIDFSGTTPTFMSMYTVSNAGSGNFSSTSSDGGYSWTRWPSDPPGNNGPGGAVAVSTPFNFVVYPYINRQGAGLSYTTDGAQTWNLSSVTGCRNDFIGSYFNNRQPLAADKATDGTFYAIDQAQNICKSSDGGAHFTLARAAPIEGFVYRDVVKAVPGQAGHFFYALGPQNKPHPQSTSLWKTTNGGPNLAKVAAGFLRDVWYVGFGAPKPGNTYPAIYVQGWLKGAQCICESDDGGATWAPIAVPPNQFWPVNSFDALNDLSGDINVYGRIYVNFIDSGAAFVDTATACPWVGFINAKPTQSFTGTVTLTAEHSGQVPVAGVNFYVDGTQIGTTQSGTGPYSVSWNTGSVTAGAHTLKVLATGNNANCTTNLAQGNSFSIPVTTH